MEKLFVINDSSLTNSLTCHYVSLHVISKKEILILSRDIVVFYGENEVPNPEAKLNTTGPPPHPTTSLKNSTWDNKYDLAFVNDFHRSRWKFWPTTQPSRQYSTTHYSTAREKNDTSSTKQCLLYFCCTHFKLYIYMACHINTGTD